MAMLGPSDREADRQAGLRALFLILGLGAVVLVMVAIVAFFYFRYGY
jgi:hypothetical protein